MKPNLTAANALRQQADWYADRTSVYGVVGINVWYDSGAGDWWILKNSDDSYIFSQAELGTEASYLAAADAAESAAYSDAMLPAKWPVFRQGRNFIARKGHTYILR